MKKTTDNPAQEPSQARAEEKSTEKQPAKAAVSSSPAPDGGDGDPGAADSTTPPANGAQTTPQTPPADVPATDDSFLRQLAEAEQRGYLRGRNESIEQLMREPAPLERPSAPSRPEPESGESVPMILNNPRVSIWDR